MAFIFLQGSVSEIPVLYEESLQVSDAGDLAFINQDFFFYSNSTETNGPIYTYSYTGNKPKIAYGWITGG